MEPVNQHEDLEDALSLERFARYMAWANENRNRAIELYTLNSVISESLYIPLQILEVALRNRIHTVMSVAYDNIWFKNPDVIDVPNQQGQLDKAIADLERKKKEPIPGRIVAELTFGFWTAMFGKGYENLWQTTLHQIAQKPNGKGMNRKEFSAPLATIRELRNRVAHHEPIISWNLPKHVNNIVQLTGYLSPPAKAWCLQHARFAKAYPEGGIELHESSLD